MTKVGIPKSLFYYYYYPLWSTFFKELCCEVITSPNTNKNIVNNGIKATVDEVCFPVKTYFGHVHNLLNKVDYIFCPRIVSIELKAFICPKFMGLPDMVATGFHKEDIKILAPIIKIDKKNNTQKRALINLALSMGYTSKQADKSWESADKTQKYYEVLINSGVLPTDAFQSFESGLKEEEVKSQRIAVLGHGYNLYDDYLSMNIIHKVNSHGYGVITPEMISNESIEDCCKTLRKKIFWTLGKRIIGSTLHLIQTGKIKGVIYIASFGCGPDSLIGHLTESAIRKSKIPFMLLTVDEHTGEAGINTRLEAFLDMLQRRDAV
ncbi:MAG: acyl-CoA dehydratase activase-related protein [Bacillota bacterium]